MASQQGEQTITKHILLNISRSKDNQTIQLGQLKLHQGRFENLPICLCLTKNNILKISHS